MRNKKRAQDRKYNASDDDEVMDSDTELIIQETKAAQTTKGTKENYESHVKTMSVCLSQNYAHIIENGEILLPLPDNAVINFFNSVKMVTKVSKNKSTIFLLRHNGF